MMRISADLGRLQDTTYSIGSLLLISLLAISVPLSVHGQPVLFKRHATYVGEEAPLTLITPEGQRIYRRRAPALVDIVVGFEESPLFIAQHQEGAPKADPAAYTIRFAEFEADVARIVASPSIASKHQPAVQWGRTYFKVFYGASLTLPAAALAQVRALPYVRQVYVDVPMQAVLEESVPLIQGDRVWEQYGTQGEDIVVAIIDTGIDYMHPALGGGLGAGFKVIGGYDFVNDDNDPLDDNGHGTHVAGIVAADGEEIRGVAPKAQLLAYKVLDAAGAGFSETILAAVERSVDPNEDGDSSDHADIVNLSLGGPGTPDDPVSVAIDNASTLGVTFCVAAGNDGRFNAIGSPGTAHSAITVGASDKLDHLAPFSSKGPNPRTFSIKPEVVAPGVAIRSTSRNGGSETLNGTSMATPHVAGVAALLQSVHPDWGPDELKSALVTSAVDLGEEVMAQGGGRIDALRAIETRVFADPALLSFGLVDIEQTNWTTAQTIQVSSQATTTQTVVATVADLPTGVDLVASPASFALNPGETQDVDITLTVDNDVVPFPEEGSLSYSGAVQLSSKDASLRIPWAFTKASIVTLVTDEPFANFVLKKVDSPFAIFAGDLIPLQPDPFRYDFPAPAGTYDLLVKFSETGPGFVFREQVPIEGSIEMNVQSTEAVHTVTLQAVDERGQPLSAQGTLQNALFVDFPSSDERVYTTGSADIGQQSFRTSAVSDRFRFRGAEYQDDLTTNHIFRVVQHTPLNGVSGDAVLTNDPAALVEQPIRVNVPSGAATRRLFFTITQKLFFPERNLLALFSTSAVQTQPSADVWEGHVVLNTDASERIAFTTSVIATPDENPFRTSWFESQPLFIVADQVGSFGRQSPATYLAPEGSPLPFGDGPIYTNAYFFNNRYSPSNVAVRIPTGFGLSFFGPLDEVRDLDLASSEYRLEDAAGNVVASDMLSEFVNQAVPPGAYTFEITNGNYTIADGAGTARLTTRFDLRHDDPNPPRLTSLRLLNAEQQVVNRFEQDETVLLRFSAGNYLLEIDGEGRIFERYEPVEEARLYVRAHGTEPWDDVELSPLDEDPTIGLLHEADLSATTMVDSSAFDLRLEVLDRSDNATEWVLAPAFTVGEYVLPTSVEDPSREAAPPLRYALHANYPNPFNPSTLIRYSLPQAEHVTITVYNALGQQVTVLVNELRPAGNHRVRFEASDLASGIYYYRIEAGRFAASRAMLVIR